MTLLYLSSNYAIDIIKKFTFGKLKFLASSFEINSNLNIKTNNEKFNLINLIIDKINYITKE